MSAAPVPEESGFASGFSSSRPSAFVPLQPPGPGGRAPARGGGVRYRHRAHALAPEREYRVGTHPLRWHDAARPERGAGQLACRQIAALRLETLSGHGDSRPCRLTLRPRGGAGGYR